MHTAPSLYLDAYVCLAGEGTFPSGSKIGTAGGVEKRCREAPALQVTLTVSLRVCLRARLGQGLRHGLRQHLEKYILKQSRYASFLI